MITAIGDLLGYIILPAEDELVLELCVLLLDDVHEVYYYICHYCMEGRKEGRKEGIYIAYSTIPPS